MLKTTFLDAHYLTLIIGCQPHHFAEEETEARRG